MKVLIVAGHTNGKDGGAYSPTLKMTEFQYNTKVMEHLKGFKDIECHYQHSLQSYFNRQKALAYFMQGKGFDLVLELHFNSFIAKTTTDTECLYFHSSEQGKEYAKIISSEISKDFGTKLRHKDGTFPIDRKHQNGYQFLKLTPCPAIIVEPFFHQNENAELFKDTEKYACTLFNAIAKIRKIAGENSL